MKKFALTMIVSADDSLTEEALLERLTEWRDVERAIFRGDCACIEEIVKELPDEKG